MSRPLSPAIQAAELRTRAASLDGAERDYCLWLAGEWDKASESAAMERPPRRPVEDEQGALHSLTLE